MPEQLSAEQVQQGLTALPGWSLDADKLFRRIECDDFVAAFGLMTRIALLAERAGHHPEWFNVYKRVDIWLTTHDAGGISEQDLALAREINALL